MGLFWKQLLARFQEAKDDVRQKLMNLSGDRLGVLGMELWKILNGQDLEKFLFNQFHLEWILSRVTVPLGNQGGPTRFPQSML